MQYALLFLSSIFEVGQPTQLMVLREASERACLNICCHSTYLQLKQLLLQTSIRQFYEQKYYVCYKLNSFFMFIIMFTVKPPPIHLMDKVLAFLRCTVC